MPSLGSSFYPENAGVLYQRIVYNSGSDSLTRFLAYGRSLRSPPQALSRQADIGDGKTTVDFQSPHVPGDP